MVKKIVDKYLNREFPATSLLVTQWIGTGFEIGRTGGSNAAHADNFF